jgi:hypothetical protein
MADTGGYMGLLCGASILSIYDEIIKHILIILKKKTTPTK